LFGDLLSIFILNEHPFLSYSSFPSYTFIRFFFRGISVGIVTRLRAGRPDFDFWEGLRNFLFTTTSRPHFWSPASPLSNGYRGYFPGGKATEA